MFNYVTLQSSITFYHMFVT